MGHKSEPMSDRQAEVEARRRFGADGVAWHNGCARKGDLRYCQVGLRIGDVQEGWTVLGFGESWELAFTMADTKRAKK